MTGTTTTAPPGFFTRDDCRIDDFRALVETPTPAPPGADEIRQGVPVYTAATLRDRHQRDGNDRATRAELATVLHQGAGILVIAGAFEADVVDRATVEFQAMIAQQHAEGRAVGDHYAKPGANDRVWNAIEKLAVQAPDVFVDYYANDVIALGARSWLGPNYQISSQINVVNPGGEAQQPHRDFHLGFMTDDEAEDYPAHTHLLSPVLTLQGAVAHCDMPVESGPTMYLPNSQKYGPGFLAWRKPEFIEYFQANYTQLPLQQGDVVFFNPALFHAAGTNRTTHIARMANLIQVSSAMGRAMETMDRIRMSKAVYEALQARAEDGLSADLVRNAATAAADGYAFPTNLDRDPPLGGLTPPSHLDLLMAALAQRSTLDQFATELDALVTRRATS